MEGQEETFEKVEIYDSPEALAAGMAASQEVESQPQQQAPEQELSLLEQASEQIIDEGWNEQEPEDNQPEYDDGQEYQDDRQDYQGGEEEIEYSDEDIEEAVFSYLSERLGQDINSFDYFTENQQYALDERVESIARFVEETGRSPQDWFTYQSLNPSEMDDVTAVRVSMAADYPNLEVSELDALIASKYKTDPSLHSDEEIRISSIQMKVDAENARKKIEEIRSEYAEPEYEQKGGYESPIDENWIDQMIEEVGTLEGLEFDLGNGQTFTFGLSDRDRDRLVQQNARLDEYFDEYIYEDGTWDYDTLSSHRAVIDNIDAIVSAAYKQGLGDGQKGLVQKAANVQTQSPNQGGVPQSNPMAQQIKNIMRQSSSKVMFNPNR